MAKGDKKKQYMDRGHTEAQYYDHSRGVCKKRVFNVRLNLLLSAAGFDPYTWLRNVENRTYPEDPLPDEEYVGWLTSEITCPVRLLREYQNARGDGLVHTMDFTLDGIIARYLRPFPEESFHRWGDRNMVEKPFYKAYCHSEGTPIDVQAQELVEYHPPGVEPGDIVDFCLRYPRGKHTYKFESRADKIAWAFYQVTGWRINDEWADVVLPLIDDKTPPFQDEDPPF